MPKKILVKTSEARSDSSDSFDEPWMKMWIKKDINDDMRKEVKAKEPHRVIAIYKNEETFK